MSSLKLTAHPWKWMVGWRSPFLLAFGLFSGDKSQFSGGYWPCILPSSSNFHPRHLIQGQTWPQETLQTQQWPGHHKPQIELNKVELKKQVASSFCWVFLLVKGGISLNFWKFNEQFLVEQKTNFQLVATLQIMKRLRHLLGCPRPERNYQDSGEMV